MKNATQTIAPVQQAASASEAGHTEQTVPAEQPDLLADTLSDKCVMLVFNPSHQREGSFRGLFGILGEQRADAGKFLKLYDKYDSIHVNPASALP